MSDQAEVLRRMVLRAEPTRAAASPSGSMVLVHGVQPRVGASTVALQLALAWKRQGVLAALIDADLRHPTLHQRCQLTAHETLWDVMAQRKTLREVWITGPCGLPVVVGRPPDEDAGQTWVAGDPVIDQIAQSARHQRICVDVGSRDNLPALLPVASHCLFVASAKPAEVIDVYRQIKQAATHIRHASCWVLFNQVADPAEAAAAMERLALTADRCLNLALQFAGSLPGDAAGADSTESAQRVRGGTGSGSFQQAIERVARRLESLFNCTRGPTLAEVAS